MSDYDRIAQAIAFITNRVNGQPALAEIATHLNMSPHHFQRLFCRWAGVTPMKKFFALVLLLLSFHICADEGMTPNEQEKWFNEDESFSPDQINVGELKFLPEPPETPVLHSLNVLTVSQDSIENGWVSLEQCYKHLDPVPDAEVVYRYKSMRDLRITSKRNIETVLVQGQSVQLTNITHNAELCVKAEVRIFYKNSNGTFSLVNGPFHRKFLDGYYPFHVTLEINYPSSLLELVQTKPEAQAGFNIKKSANFILIESFFEGILNTEIIFQLHPLSAHHYPGICRDNA